MRTELHPLPPAAPGTRHELVSLHYGTPGRGPKVVIQASLHADEVPGMLVAHHLRGRLAALEAQGRVSGEVVLVPAANPLGLNQWMLRAPQGRFDWTSGENFNRQFADLTQAVFDRVGTELGPDAAANVARVRAALRDAVAALPAVTPLEHLRRTLLGLAIDADTVLDLHCDGQAVLHLYTTHATWASHGELLARCLGAEVALLADRSGGDPFDEACSMVWCDLAAKLRPDQPLPPACLAATIELRGEHDVKHALASRDAEAILAYLHHRGAIRLDPAPPLPETCCEPTPLAGSMPMHAPHGGVLVFLREVGEHVRAGEPLAEVIDPLTGAASVLTSPVDGLFFACECKTFAVAGMAIGKVAGRQALRSGALLSV
ncbi:succinylglutamate desuccinylase/aspartoacylase family protein [Ideonella sp.]|uniref:succinylglutamate desuccinylase/aspartoacylase family protein n=1 Tax=Ideonella sp. TaxID=1929293 RepID=UPI002B48B5C4|nr:succinylglutamate desuccinylase/aspartoacylase family protein [Ideonella sp.]HJV68930.1 succinylglutamate desuccinylase/aspartoacylase family protein [Ideonella sp.]